MPKLQRAKTVACGLLRWDRCCIIVVSHWSKPAGQNMASLLVVVGFRTSHSMPKEESHVIFSKNLPLKGVGRLGATASERELTHLPSTRCLSRLPAREALFFSAKVCHCRR